MLRAGAVVGEGRQGGASSQLDLLVLGSKAKRTWRRRLGGTVEAALQRTDLPLLVVPEATVW